MSFPDPQIYRSDFYVSLTEDSPFISRINIRNENGGEVKNVRIHNALTAFFLKLFGKIVEFEGIDSNTYDKKIYYVNKNSLLKRSPNRDQAKNAPYDLVNFVTSQVRDETERKQRADAENKERRDAVEQEVAEDANQVEKKRSIDALSDTDLLFLIDSRVITNAGADATADNEPTIGTHLLLLALKKDQLSSSYKPIPEEKEAIKYLRGWVVKKNVQIDLTKSALPLLQKSPVDDLSDLDLLKKIDRRQLIDGANQALFVNNDAVARALYRFSALKIENKFDESVIDPDGKTALKFLREWLKKENIQIS